MTVHKHAQPGGKLKSARGFTLIELMIVVGIIALLIALIGPNIVSSFSKGQKTAAAAQISNLETALDSYRLDVGRYPQTLEGLVENDSGRDAWAGPYMREIPLDPWGYAFHYEAQSRDFVLLSYGADGAPGGQDDDADIER